MFERGDQIAYIPHHVSGDVEHPDVELGFVTSVDGDRVWCRFWRKGEIGKLRTIANSELVMQSDLVHYQSVSRDQVESALDSIAEADAAYFLNIKRDPVKLEWVVIDMGGDQFIAIHPFNDFQRNFQVAKVCAQALIDVGLMHPRGGSDATVFGKRSK